MAILLKNLHSYGHASRKCVVCILSQNFIKTAASVSLRKSVQQQKRILRKEDFLQKRQKFQDTYETPQKRLNHRRETAKLKI